MRFTPPPPPTPPLRCWCSARVQERRHIQPAALMEDDRHDGEGGADGEEAVQRDREANICVVCLVRKPHSHVGRGRMGSPQPPAPPHPTLLFSYHLCHTTFN